MTPFRSRTHRGHPDGDPQTNTSRNSGSLFPDTHLSGGACCRSQAMTVQRGAGEAPVRVGQSRISWRKNQSMGRGATVRLKVIGP